jgi:flagellar biosynthetic protein FlhB
MAENSEEAGSKTESATPRRLQRAREEGRVPVSREIPAACMLGAAALAWALSVPSAAGGLTRTLSVFLSRAGSEALTGPAALALAGHALLQAVAPFAVAMLLAAAGAVLLQTGFLVSFSPLRPRMQRISPRAGVKRIAGWTNLAEAGKSLAKVIVAGAAFWHFLAGEAPALLHAVQTDPHLIPRLAVRPVLILLLILFAIQAAIGVLDVLLVRLRHARQLRMTREEVREEQKETEGDPRLKARIKQIRLQRARRRMLAAVPKATVVVTNPTHYAVALMYDRAKSAAPKVVAKGVDSMAARIRETAEANGVPLVANPPLTRALYTVELDREIPAEHYQAVAELIAYVWRLSKAAGAGAR